MMRRIMLALSRVPGVKIFRNNVGVGWAGKADVIHKPMSVVVGPGDVVVRNARPLHAGLFKGSADLIGWHTVTVTPDMVGQRLAVFLSTEVKEGRDKERADQEQWRRVVSDSGGIAFVARSEQDALDALQRHCNDATGITGPRAAA